MKYIHNDENFLIDGATAVTLGKFDGVHVGHQKLISLVNEKARSKGLLSAVYTFDRIPLSICPSSFQHFVTTNTERRMLLDQLGIDIEVEYPFTQKLMETAPQEFIENIIVNKLRAKYVVVGTDFRFGKDRLGTPEMLKEAGPHYGFETIIVEKEKYQGREISSTYVREELKLGHMETVNVLLNRPFSILGIVSKGRQLGRELQLPTMNIYPTENKMLPPNGVYASITVIDGKEYYGVTNIGVKPTVCEQKSISVETHAFDFMEDAYGKHIEVKLIHFIRQEMKFDKIEMLKKQMEADAVFAKEMFMLG